MIDVYSENDYIVPYTQFVTHVPMFETKVNFEELVWINIFL